MEWLLNNPEEFQEYNQMIIKESIEEENEINELRNNIIIQFNLEKDLILLKSIDEIEFKARLLKYFQKFASYLLFNIYAFNNHTSIIASFFNSLFEKNMNVNEQMKINSQKEFRLVKLFS